MTERTMAAFLERLDAADARLAALSEQSFPPGLTEPDPGGEERWDAPRVWAHVAEFVPYWIGQAKVILAGDGAAPVPFGRLADDPGRAAAIERDRLLPADELRRRVRSGIEAARAFAFELHDADWERQGQHPRRGPVTVGFVLEVFVATHLGEHATQLEGLQAAG